jgi:RNA polymerase sigma-70 factor (ECF subfamily)
LEDLKDIIEACASGDVRAQEKLYHRFAPKMLGVCLRYAKDLTEAEDNLQEGFIKVFMNIKKFRHEGSLEGWIRRIMVNVSLERFRKQNIMYPVEDISRYESPQISDEIMARISADELIAIIQELPPRYKMAFNLFVMEGFSHQQISEEMQISVGTSKSNIARARDILKRKVQNLYKVVGTNENYSA